MTQTVLAPQYYKKFKCSGGSCPDDCCHDMLIGVDELTYKSFLSLGEGAGRGRPAEAVEITGSDPFRAVIALDENGDCPFLDRGGLCGIQLEHGHEALSYACRTYPRMFCDAGGGLEAYMSMGCSGAARTALPGAEKMKLGRIQIETVAVCCNTLEPGKYAAGDDAAGLFRRLRGASVSILQMRRHRLWFRVLMLGLFIQKAGSLLAEGMHDEVAGFAGEYMESLEGVDFGKYKDNVPDRPDMKVLRIFSFFEAVADNRRGKKRDSLCGCIGRMREGLGITGLDMPVMEAAGNYVGARDSFYAPFFDEREHILENYMVNAVLSSGFPFSYRQEKSIYGNFVRLASRYSLLKFLLVGAAGYYKEAFGEDEAIAAISAFARFFDHDKDITDALVDSFNRNMAIDLATVCTLAKD